MSQKLQVTKTAPGGKSPLSSCSFRRGIGGSKHGLRYLHGLCIVPFDERCDEKMWARISAKISADLYGISHEIFLNASPSVVCGGKNFRKNFRKALGYAFSKTLAMSQMITSKSYLDPVLPENLPDSIIQAADQLPRKAEFLAGRLAAETTDQLAGLLRLTNTYYSNLIEGHHSEIRDLQAARAAPKRERKQLTDLAVHHMDMQESFEQLLSQRPPESFANLFDPNLIQMIHYGLFKGATEQDLTLGDGRLMVPGKLRAEENERVQVGEHVAPAASAVLPMLTSTFKSTSGGSRILGGS